VKQRRDARARVFSARTNLQESKWGVSIYPETVVGDDTMVEKGKAHDIVFTIISSSSEDDGVVTLQDITLGGGMAKSFQLLAKPSLDMQLLPFENFKFTVRFLSKGTGVYRTTLKFLMTRNSQSETCTMARYIKVRSGDAVLQEKLKPTKPYKKKRRRAKLPKASGEVVQPPKSTSGALPSILQKRLPKYYAPKLIQRIIEKGEVETELQGLLPKDSVEDYAEFWQTMLWASEHQAKRDMSFFDLEDARLVPEGRYFLLRVPGLAEGRPSVLRGDTVFVTWNERRYIGRVMFVRQLEIGLELAKSFHKSFHANLDSVHIRFSFSRTTFRTSHHGSVMASSTMGNIMLFPETEDARSASFKSRTAVAGTLHWGNRELNDQQHIAVKNILSGSGRPLPYIIYGPPGTGKTTTVTEVVYQLAKHPDRLKILLVAPSNDAADILVAKLSSHFPPSEMRRILAFSRSMDTVPMKLRPYCKAELSELDQKEEIEATRIVISTVSLAARFSFIGIEKGYFDVLCVDEAGHATEPEVIAVAATLMDFDEETGSGQLILAGDPKQLGPIVPSDVCAKFGMAMSYMERLTLRGAYGRSSTDRQYPPHLLTKLIQNYRSHPAIMQLPNVMFYDNELLMCGNELSTHNMARWEHLPKQGFPILFHSVHGENLREDNSPSWFNPQEAAEVANYVDLLINQTKAALKPEEIGVITPYNRQAHKIGTALKLKGISGVKVGSVETFQGQERRVIVISTVRAENDLVEFDRKYNLGFVANEKRFNVAITRAKALLIVIGHPKVLATDKARWLPLLRFCKENDAWLGESWDEDAEDSEDELEGSEEGSVYEDAEEGGISAAVAQEGMAYVNREE
jgi:helicase MOV-10